MSKKKLLFVSPIPLLPVHDGASLRAYQFMRGLASISDLTLLCTEPANSDSKAHLQGLCRVCFAPMHSVNGSHKSRGILGHLQRLITPPAYYPPDRWIQFDPVFWSKVHEENSRHNFDGIFCFGTASAGYGRWGKGSANVVIDHCDANSLWLFSQTMNFLRKKKMKDAMSSAYDLIYALRWERSYLLPNHKHIVITERDARWLRRSLPGGGDVFVVENGVDTDYFHPDLVSPGGNQSLIVFFGVMNYSPNHDAVCYFIKNILPLIHEKKPEAIFRIIGRNPREELLLLAAASKNVEVLGEVDDIRKYLRGARVFVCPMREGAGMKNKVLESMAMAIPVVSTREGVEGIRFDGGKMGFVADDPKFFADRVIALMCSDSAWGDFSTRARSMVVEEYSWAEKAKKLAEVIF